MGEVIAMLSGKGGTGKTAVCAALATALSLAGKKVLCIDCDAGLRNLDIFLGMPDTGALSCMDVCSGNYPLSMASEHPKLKRLFLLTAPVTNGPEDIPQAQFEDMLQKARKDFDYILLDAPAGLGVGMKLCASASDRGILVTIPDPASVRCATRTVQLLDTMGIKNVRLVVNRTYPEILKAMKTNIDDLMDMIGLPLLGVIPADPNFSFAAAAATPMLLYTRRGASPAISRIARRLQGFSVPIAIR